MKNRCLPVRLSSHTIAGCCALFFSTTAAVSGVVVNEIHYDPVDNGIEPGSLREFVEIYNPSSATADLSDYSLSRGIQYSFPSGTELPPDAYLVVARDPDHLRWGGADYLVLGPFQGKLSNDGERVRLSGADGRTIEDLRYNDVAPWPSGADGYGPSLERIAWDLPPDDHHSWRASLMDDGTAGRINSVAGTVPYPLIRRFETIPPYPRSGDEVTAILVFDTPEIIHSVSLKWERIGIGTTTATSSVVPMERVPDSPEEGMFRAVIPPHPSQSLVRFNCTVTRTDGKTVELPHAAEPRDFVSYFVYDGEYESPLPILWKFGENPSRHFSRAGVVVLGASESIPQVYDGVSVESSRNGEKVKFLRGEEFRGDRTINIIPEHPGEGTSSGGSAPFREFLAFRFFQESSVLSPRVDWFRVIENWGGGTPRYAQRLVIQQVNELFLEMNGRTSDGYLFKRNYYTPLWEPHTNKEEGTTAIDELETALETKNHIDRERALRTSLNWDAFIRYSAASILLTNWDGFHNNHWMYRGPNPDDTWEIIPWDLDKTWGYTDPDPQFTVLPTSFPVNGRANRVSRSPGPITGPAHLVGTFHLEYLNRLLAALDTSFQPERLVAQIDEMESLLLEDLTQIEEFTGSSYERRRNQIAVVCDLIREYITPRREYLLGTLESVSPPGLEYAAFLDRNRILLLFDQDLDYLSTIVAQNYWVDYGIGHPDKGWLNSLYVHLDFPEPFCSGVEYETSTAGIRDATHAASFPTAQKISLQFTTPPVSITEIVYDNRGKDAEWIELFNTTDSPVDVSGWYITDDDTYPSVDEGHVTLPQGTVLQPGEAAVVNLWNDPSDPDPPDYSQWQMPESVRVIDAIVGVRGDLEDSGDNIALFDSSTGGRLIDGSLTSSFPDLSIDGEAIEKDDPFFSWDDDLSVGTHFVSTTGPFGVATGSNGLGDALSPYASPGRVRDATPPGHCPPARVYDIWPDLPDDRVNANDLLEWISRTRRGELSFGLKGHELLFEFSRDWRIDPASPR